MVLKKFLLCFLYLSIFISVPVSALDVAIVSDLHYGNAQGDGSANDIQATLNWLNNTQPDYVFLLGDLTDDSDPQSWDEFFSDFENLLNTTNISKVFFVLGGSHDGFEDDAAGTSFNGGQDYGWNGFNAFRRFSENLSGAPLYTIEIGNNVFIFMNHMDLNYDKLDMEYGNDPNKTYQQVIPMIYIDWLEKKLQYYSNKSYNIFVLMHPPLNNTNQLTASWWGMTNPSWQITSSHLKRLFDKYNVDVFVSGHVHSDPSDIISEAGAHSGKVVFGRNFTDLPDTTFIQTGVVCWEHGKDQYGDYPSAYLLRIYENKTYAELTAYNVNTGANVGISYDDSPTTANVLNIPLKYSVNLQGYRYSYEWIPYRLPDEGVDVQWFKETKGIMVTSDASYEFVWHWSEPKNVVSLQVNYTEQNGSVSATYYVSDDGVSWQEATLPISGTRWLKIVLSTSVTNPPLYISWIYPEISGIIKDYYPKTREIVIKVFTNVTFNASFWSNYTYEWYLDGNLIHSGFGNETSVTIQFNETGSYELKLFVNNSLAVSWKIHVFKVIPNVVITHFTKIVLAKERPKVEVNITNLQELEDYIIYVDIHGDGIVDITTKNFSIDLPEFRRPALYTIVIKVVDPITGSYNKTSISIQVVSKRLYLGRNIVNVTGWTTYAETDKTVYVHINPIKVDKEFLVIVNHEDINASEHGEEILNVTFSGLAGGNKLWINETVLKAEKVDIFHNGELIATVPVRNNSVNSTVETFSTYVFAVNKTAPLAGEEEKIIEGDVISIVLLVIVTVLFLAIVSIMVVKVKESARVFVTSNFRFFRKIK